MAVAGAVALLAPTPAFAHALLVEADPGPGAVTGSVGSVRLTFSEPVTPFGRGLELVSPSGRQLPGKVKVIGRVLELRPGDGELREPGTYRVTWRVVAGDTHPSRGGYTFSIEHSSAPPAGDPSAGDVGSVSPGGLVLQVVARWAHFAGAALTFGVLALQFLVIREPVPGRRLRRLVGVGIGLLLVAEPIALIAQAVSLGSVEPAGLVDVAGASFGRLAALRVGVALALWGLLGALAEVRWRGALLISALGLALGAIDGLSGHSIAGLPLIVADALTALHISAMTVWVGSVVALVVLSRESIAISLVRRFSVLAVVDVLVLILSGGILALGHLRGVADLVFTSYGAILGAKMVVVGIALAAARSGLRAGRSGRPEVIALAGVLALAGLLASLPPPR